MNRRLPLALALALSPALWLASGAARGADDDDKAVRAAFADFQAAVKAGDPDKLWALLSDGARADVEAAAQKLKEDYTKAGPKDKAKLEKAAGLSAEEMGSLTGKLYVKSKRYLGKYDEVPDGKVEKVTIDGDKATVAYAEPDGDHEKMQAVREGGKWKLVAPPG